MAVRRSSGLADMHSPGATVLHLVDAACRTTPVRTVQRGWTLWASSLFDFVIHDVLTQLSRWQDTPVAAAFFSDGWFLAGGRLVRGVRVIYNRNTTCAACHLYFPSCRALCRLPPEETGGFAPVL